MNCFEAHERPHRKILPQSAALKVANYRATPWPQRALSADGDEIPIEQIFQRLRGEMWLNTGVEEQFEEIVVPESPRCRSRMYARLQ